MTDPMLSLMRSLALTGAYMMSCWVVQTDDVAAAADDEDLVVVEIAVVVEAAAIVDENPLEIHSGVVGTFDISPNQLKS
ncbi:hypothetical protein G6F42_019354 [Rhizopus arrhizus]|nr:hypothetical protein G6F42_019354 [Rhizopus arrhizus]